MEKWVHAIKTIAHINSAQIYIKYAKRHKRNKEANNPAMSRKEQKCLRGWYVKREGAKGPELVAIGAVAYKNELGKYTQTRAHTYTHTLAHTRAENVQGKS